MWNKFIGKNLINKIIYMQDPNDDSVLDNVDEEAKHLMDEYGIDSDTAERAEEVMDNKGVTEDEAIEEAEEN